MNHKYILKIFIIFSLILMTIFLINSIGLNLNEPDQPKKLLNVITMEGFNKGNLNINKNNLLNVVNGNNKNPLILNSSKAFCDVNKGGQQEKACNALTKYNCGLTSCCIWTSDNKCKAGNQSGPLFNTDSNGKTISLPYYYFQNQCYGPSCPSS